MSIHMQTTVKNTTSRNTLPENFATADDAACFQCQCQCGRVEVITKAELVSGARTQCPVCELRDAIKDRHQWVREFAEWMIADAETCPNCRGEAQNSSIYNSHEMRSLRVIVNALVNPNVGSGRDGPCDCGDTCEIPAAERASLEEKWRLSEIELRKLREAFAAQGDRVSASAIAAADEASLEEASAYRERGLRQIRRVINMAQRANELQEAVDHCSDRVRDTVGWLIEMMQDVEALVPWSSSPSDDHDASVS